MEYTVLPSQFHNFADSANHIIKNRFNLKDGIVEQAIDHSIPYQPTLHWELDTYFLACEVSNKPFPDALKLQFADIVRTGIPIKIIVAYTLDVDMTTTDYRKNIKEAKEFGFGFMVVDEDNRGEIEHDGILLALHIPPIDYSEYPKKLQPYIREAYEKYMVKCDPQGSLQNIGQLTENIIYNIATQAKRRGVFTYTRFNPPKYISQSTLIDKLIDENIFDIPMLGRCKSFAIDRNGVSHKPKTLRQAKNVQTKLKENFIIGLRILKDLPPIIKSHGYRLKP